MRIGVYGLGRFGTFWADKLSEFADIVRYSLEDRSRPGEGREQEAEVLSSDAVFFCVPISALEETLRSVRNKLSPRTLVFDTCSVKLYPVKLMERMLPPENSVIASHPMFGPDSGKESLEGRSIVLCPVRASEEKIREWEEFFRNMGLRIRFMTPDEHDHEAAYTQGITHFLGRVLNEFSLPKRKLATHGYELLQTIREQTCNDSWLLFSDLQHYNPYTKEMREELQEKLQAMLDKLTCLETTKELTHG